MSKGRKVIYPGTFDPITNGHLDILRRAATLFDEVTVAVVAGGAKTPIFALPERIELITKVVNTLKFPAKIKVEAFTGLLTTYARKKGVKTVIRGLRALSDFEYEFQMALMNRHLQRDFETVFLMPDEKYVYLSSSMVREVARLHGDLGTFLPKAVLSAVEAKFRR